MKRLAWLARARVSPSTVRMALLLGTLLVVMLAGTAFGNYKYE